MVKALAGKPWARKQVACTEDDKKKSCADRATQRLCHNRRASVRE